MTSADASMMRQAVLGAPGEELTVRLVPIPIPVGGEALLRITASTVCAMTDTATLDGIHPPHSSGAHGLLPHELRMLTAGETPDDFRDVYPPLAYPGTVFPAAMGHEAAGVIVALGEGANSPERLVFAGEPLAVGDRVGTYKVHGGYGEYSALSTDNLFKIPDSMSDEEASLIEPLIANFNCLERCWKIREPKTVAILGQGCQGLMSTQIVRAFGAERVYVTEPSAYKRALAIEFGADVALDPTQVNVVHELHRLTAGRGVDLVVECVGRPDTVRITPYLVRRGGMVAQVGAIPVPVALDYGYVHFKHYIVVASDYFTSLRDVSGQLANALALIEEGKIELKRMITHRTSLDEIAAAFRWIRTRPDDLVKMAVQI
jgi:2-desacetyl-2-hydroxyethyl bacteriochlorophyllide A dehydrogenase